MFQSVLTYLPAYITACPAPIRLHRAVCIAVLVCYFKLQNRLAECLGQLQLTLEVPLFTTTESLESTLSSLDFHSEGKF